MEGILDQIVESLQKQLGLHRNLFECLRLEKEALQSFQSARIQERTLEKESILHAIQESERARAKLVLEWTAVSGKPEPAITVTEIIERIQGRYLPQAEKLKAVQSSLSLLLQRLIQVNEDNRSLVESGLKHVQEMKRNVLGASAPQGSGYTQRGTRALPDSATEGRLLSGEA